MSSALILSQVVTSVRGVASRAHGRHIILNGSSSAGKTTIAGELQLLSDELFLRSSIDHFLHNLPLRVFDEPNWCRVDLDAEGRMMRVTLGPNARASFCTIYRAIAEFTSAGFSVIIDDVLYDREVVRFAAKTTECDRFAAGLVRPFPDSNQRFA